MLNEMIKTQENDSFYKGFKYLFNKMTCKGNIHELIENIFLYSSKNFL